ncbi:MAG: glycosyltransferase family 2 protein [Prevotella sp.]|jgi:glycosyltransferase involved in cell wall biosynthesis|nr:glycosyltransferase family 2 protein [Prevotella sp.]
MVSVLLPNYNHALYLQQRIECILNQTYQDFELIILDDCSSDDSKSIIEQYRNDPHITHIVYNKENSGSTFKQWNKGVKLAKGEYIWIAESDDIADINFLQTLVPKIHQNSTNIVYCQSNRLSSDNIVTGTWLDFTDDLDPVLFQKDFLFNGHEFIKRFLIYKNVIPNASAVIFRKSVFNSVGGADESVEKCSDWLLWLKLMTLGDIYFCSKALNHFRYHPDSVIAKITSEKSIFDIFKYDHIMRTKFDIFLQNCSYSEDIQLFIIQNKQEITKWKLRVCSIWYHYENKNVSKIKKRILYLYHLKRYGVLATFLRQRYSNFKL